MGTILKMVGDTNIAYGNVHFEVGERTIQMTAREGIYKGKTIEFDWRLIPVVVSRLISCHFQRRVSVNVMQT